MTIKRVAVEIHFGVKADQIARAGYNQRVNLQKRHVLFNKSAIEIGNQGGSLFHLVALQPQRKGDLAPVMAGYTTGGVNIDRQNFFRCLRRHFLNVHAAFGRGDEGNARGRTVDQRRQVEFAGDI